MIPQPPCHHQGLNRDLRHNGGTLCQQISLHSHRLPSLGPGTDLEQKQPFGVTFVPLPNRERSLNVRLQRPLCLVTNDFPFKLCSNSALTGLPSLAVSDLIAGLIFCPFVWSYCICMAKYKEFRKDKLSHENLLAGPSFPFRMGNY